MDIIDNNPYRLLGVYANSPTKELVANEGKAKAFLKVGRQVTFPLDLSQFLPVANRTIETIADAKAKLTLPTDQIKYAQFWFLKVTPIDEVAFNNLLAGDMDKALQIWSKATNVSSLQNRIVCSLIRKEYGTTCRLAEQLYTESGYAAQLVEDVSSGISVPPSLAFDFLDILCDEAGTSIILSAITNDEWRQHISEKAVAPIIARIQSAVNTAKAARGKGPAESYNAGVKLMNGTKDDLAQLRRLLPTTDLQYQMIADKLGLEILQCGINYYNDTDEPDAAKKAMILQNYALTIVVGKMTKDRCQENVNILKKIIAELPPQQVFAEDKAIKDELQKYNRLLDKIVYATNLLNNTKPQLQAIKRKLGASNAYYLKISTIVVGNALSNIIAEVNDVQSGSPITDSDKLMQYINVHTVLQKAWEATLLMDNFDMEYEFKSKRYNPNRSTLEDMCDNLGISTSPVIQKPTSRPSPRPTPRPTPHPTPPSTPDDDTPWGCIVWVIVCIVIPLLIGMCSS